MIKKILNYGYIFSRICGFFIISLTLINIIFFPEFANLDWVGYKYIFENTDLYISRFITEPSIALFSLIIYSFTHFLDYSSFRSVFAFLQCSPWYTMVRARSGFRQLFLPCCWLIADLYARFVRLFSDWQAFSLSQTLQVAQTMEDTDVRSSGNRWKTIQS